MVRCLIEGGSRFCFNGAAAYFEWVVMVMVEVEVGVTKAAYWCVYELMQLTISAL